MTEQVVCPKCLAAFKGTIEKRKSNLAAQYGKIPKKEYDREYDDINEEESKSFPEKLSQSLSCGVSSEGEFYMKFQCCCCECDWQWERLLREMAYPASDNYH